MERFSKWARLHRGLMVYGSWPVSPAHNPYSQNPNPQTLGPKPNQKQKRPASWSGEREGERNRKPGNAGRLRRDGGRHCEDAASPSTGRSSGLVLATRLVIWVTTLDVVSKVIIGLTGETTSVKLFKVSIPGKENDPAWTIDGQVMAPPPVKLFLFVKL